MGFPKGTKMNISPEGRKTRSKHGRQNLEAWKKEHPGECHTTHGAGNKRIRKRYTDARTKEGKRLESIIDGFISDCGGAEALDTRQEVLLGIIRTKLITILIISNFIDREISTDNLIKNGELIPILGGPRKGLLEYAESLKRDLETLYQGNQALKHSRVPSIKEIIEGSKK